MAAAARQQFLVEEQHPELAEGLHRDVVTFTRTKLKATQLTIRPIFENELSVEAVRWVYVFSNCHSMVVLHVKLLGLTQTGVVIQIYSIRIFSFKFFMDSRDIMTP